MVEFACSIPQMLKGEFTENVGTNVDSWSISQPWSFAGLLRLTFSDGLCGCFIWQWLVEIHLY